MINRPTAQNNIEPAEFYALSVTALGDSICVEINGTKWTDRSDSDSEIRQPTPHEDTRPWESLKECWGRIEKRRDLLKFLTSGGHCLVARDVVSAWWPELLAPTECFRYTEEVPFLGSDYLPPGAEERHPPPLIRKRVLARDDYRCRVCGHSPEDHFAIKLEIHHVVEQSAGGLTIETNLITLCRSCHDNATPPDAWLRGDLFEKIVVAASRYHRRSHGQGVADYRAWVARALGAKGSEGDFENAVDYLTMDDLDESKRNAKWHFAYILLSANSLVRYFPSREWRRNLPPELKLKRR